VVLQELQVEVVQVHHQHLQVVQVLQQLVAHQVQQV
jgi:hypothetical protein